MRIVESYFGDRYAVEDVLPEAKAICVGTTKPEYGAIVPDHFLLPHQLYVRDVEKLLRMDGAKEVFISEVGPWIPIHKLTVEL